MATRAPENPIPLATFIEYYMEEATLRRPKSELIAEIKDVVKISNYLIARIPSTQKVSAISRLEYAGGTAEPVQDHQGPERPAQDHDAQRDGGPAISVLCVHEWRVRPTQRLLVQEGAGRGLLDERHRGEGDEAEVPRVGEPASGLLLGPAQIVQEPAQGVQLLRAEIQDDRDQHVRFLHLRDDEGVEQPVQVDDIQHQEQGREPESDRPHQLLRAQSGARHQAEVPREPRGKHVVANGQAGLLPEPAAVPGAGQQSVRVRRQDRPLPQQNDLHLQREQVRAQVPEAGELRGPRRDSGQRTERAVRPADTLHEKAHQGRVPSQRAECGVLHSGAVQVREPDGAAVYHVDLGRLR